MWLERYFPYEWWYVSLKTFHTDLHDEAEKFGWAHIYIPSKLFWLKVLVIYVERSSGNFYNEEERKIVTEYGELWHSWLFEIFILLSVAI